MIYLLRIIIKSHLLKIINQKSSYPKLSIKSYLPKLITLRVIYSSLLVSMPTFSTRRLVIYQESLLRIIKSKIIY